MNIEQSVDILRSLVTTSLTVSSPILIVAVTVGVTADDAVCVGVGAPVVVGE